MILRKLILHNARRFADRTATLGPFGDGLTTVTEENESGKSTFFDALHALIFHDYGSGRKEIKELQPYSGGAIRIAAEIELEGGPYRIEKVFNLKKPGSSATITDLTTGVILKQADDAERWIQDNILHSSKGPVGLLWVRQGTVGVDAVKSEAEGIDARRDVMSSVRGQIDAVTGGRKMDAILQLCRSDLEAISTKSGKAKAGSQWKEAEDLAESLREEQAKLQRSVDALSHDLDMKKRLSKRLRELDDPALRTRRLDAIKTTKAEYEKAREHDRRVKDADKDLQLLLVNDAQYGREIDEISSRRQKREQLGHTIEQKEQALESARTAKSSAQEAMARQQASIVEKEGERRLLSDALTNARQQERARSKRKRLDAIEDLLISLKDPLDQLTAAELILQKPSPSSDDLAHLYALERRRDIAQEKRKVHFSSFALSSQGEAATCSGRELPNAEALLIDHVMDVSLPGFGSICLRPADGAGQDIEDPNALQAELARALAALGFDSIKSAKEALEAHEKAHGDKQLSQTQIRALAPDGVDALKREQEQLWTDLGCAAGDAAPPTVEEDTNGALKSEQIEKTIRALDEELERQRNALPQLQENVTKSSDILTEEGVLLEVWRKELADLAATPDEEDRLQKAVQNKTDLNSKISNARTLIEQLRQQAPDLAAAEAIYQRTVKANEQDLKELHDREKELEKLNGAIETQSEGAVEEKLEEVTGRLMRAEERADQFSSHARAIELLIKHLEAARAEAQETYFEPIRTELMPLLRQLHSGAEFEIDADKLLIDKIIRNGVTERVDVLSGGAYEQIAILTRLAFARLFAKRGTHVPIILDDALVHTDDERIATMFNMLAQIAKDQQIIVLSCRTRAFSDLGGERAFIGQSIMDTRA